MSFATTYATFISDVQKDIAKKGLEITKRLENGDSFDEIVPQMYVLRDLIQEYENYWFDYYPLVKDNQPVNSHIAECFASNYHIEADMHRVYRVYDIRPYPGVIVPLAPLEIFPCNGCSLPTGGGPGYFLSKDSSGNLVWVQVGSYNYRQEFVYSSGDFEFLVGINASSVELVFINGQLIPQGLYSYDTNTFILTLLDPISLSAGDRVTVYAGIGSSQSITVNIDGEGFQEVRNGAGAVMFDSTTLKYISYEGGDNISVSFNPVSNKVIISLTGLPGIFIKEEFIWTVGGFVFNVSQTVQELFMVFINGQLLSSVDYSLTGPDEVTLVPELTINDEITVVYR